MQTRLADFLDHGPQAREAETLLRACVHCGFCNSNCPTYQLTGDELDGPRGRIYLIKNLLEGSETGVSSQRHLDRCLNCRSCEIACPSAVNYHRLLDIGREILDGKISRPWRQKLARRLLLTILPYPRRFAVLLGMGRLLRPILPRLLKSKVPARQDPGLRPRSSHARRVLLLSGCVQPALAPNTNAAIIRVLDKLGVEVVEIAGVCCGALPYHVDDRAAGLAMMRRVLDACWPHLENGAEAILSTASGCGLHLKEYAKLLASDPRYAEKAARFAALCKDPSEVLLNQDLSTLKVAPAAIAFHAPCTLQHGQGLAGAVESLLGGLGFTLTPVAEPHLCCGSAGVYSILQPELAGRLRDGKLKDLQTGQPSLIVTANIGCQMHLREKSTIPVAHWIELLDGYKL